MVVKRSRTSKKSNSPKHIIDVMKPEQMKKYLKMRNKKKPLLVWYHANGCGHCVAMNDEWNKFVESRKKNASVNIAKIENQFIPNQERQQEQVFAYPTIKLFLNGKSSEFNGEEYGGRTEQAFNNFINNKLKNNISSHVGGGSRNKKRSNRRNKRTNKRNNRQRKRTNKRQRGGKGMLDHIEDKMQVLENMLGNYSYDK